MGDTRVAILAVVICFFAIIINSLLHVRGFWERYPLHKKISSVYVHETQEVYIDLGLNDTSFPDLYVLLQGPETRSSGGYKCDEHGSCCISFRVLEPGSHVLTVRIEYASRQKALAPYDETFSTAENYIGDLVAVYTFEAVNHEIDVNFDGNVVEHFWYQSTTGVPSFRPQRAVLGVDDNKCPSDLERWFWEERSSAGTTVRRFGERDAMQCLQRWDKVVFIGDSVNQHLCQYIEAAIADAPTHAHQPRGPLAFDHEDKPGGEVVNHTPEVICERVNGMRTHETEIVDAIQRHEGGANVVVLGVGMWDVAYDDAVSIFSPQSDTAHNVFSTLAESRFSQKLFQTISCVHPIVAKSADKFLPKHFFFTKPRVEETNKLALQLARAYGVALLDVFDLVAPREDAMQRHDMRHFCDEIAREALQLLLRQICPPLSSATS
eukprot:Rmarinus@m.2807